MLRIYVIAAYTAAPAVRALHDRLRMAGHEPTSSWAESAHGPEDLASLTDEQCGAIWTQNDRDMRSADVVVVLANTPAREGWLELGRAISAGQRVIYVGRPCLTARAMPLCIVSDVDEALSALERS